MGFKKMVRSKYPPRMWSLVGYPGSGKSTFASQLKGPMVVVDADHRFQEVLHVAKDEVFQLSDEAAHNVDPSAINAQLGKNMPGSGVKTIVVDSLTAIITPLVVQAMVDKERGVENNLMSAFRTKALAMRQLQDAVSRWGCDVLWIYHLQDSRDAKSREVTRATVSDTELARLTRSINAQLEIVQDRDRRGIKIVWARRGRAYPEAPVIWDETGRWENMPERVEEAMYSGLSAEEQDLLERSNQQVFPNPETAINWGVEQGAFQSYAFAKTSYDRVKTDRRPTNAHEMAEAWIEHVQARLVQLSNGTADAEPAPTPEAPGSTPAAPSAPTEAPAAAATGDAEDDCPF